MRPRISIRGSIRPSVCLSVGPSVRQFVGNAFFSNGRKRVFSTSVGKGRVKGVVWGVEGAKGGGEGEEGVTRGADASDVWRDQTCYHMGLCIGCFLKRFSINVKKKCKKK